MNVIELTGQRALVTGAGRGMGAAIAKRLAEAGASLMVTDVNGDSVDECVALIRKAGGTASGHVLDVTDAAACQNLARKIQTEVGPISILVNNAGIGGELPIDDPGVVALWDRQIAVNLSGCFYVTYAFAPALRQTSGAVVNLASLASYSAVTRSFSYMASKAGVKLLTQSLAKELAADGVRVNAVAPGVIDTPMIALRKGDERFIAGVLARTPMGRLGRAEEVADAVLYLVSPLATFITGVILPVDGGYLAV